VNMLLKQIIIWSVMRAPLWNTVSKSAVQKCFGSPGYTMPCLVLQGCNWRVLYHSAWWDINAAVPRVFDRINPVNTEFLLNNI
jgi:hypothetical protein